jgi:hypothetical protein
MTKFDRANYGPSWAEVILGAILSLLLGIVLAAAYFVAKPVTLVKELPKEPAVGTVYYIEGSRDYGNARRLIAKEKFFVKGGSIVVNEDELNAAASPVTAPVAPGSAPTPPPTTVFTPGPPNFRIHDGVVTIAVPVRVRYELFALDQIVLVQATGSFLRRGDTFAFVPQTMYVGSCPVERIPRAVDWVLSKVYAVQPIPADIAASWARLTDVTIEGRTLRLTMP